METGAADSFNEHMEATGQQYRLLRRSLGTGPDRWALHWRGEVVAHLAAEERHAAREAGYFVMGAAHQAGKLRGAQAILRNLLGELEAVSSEEVH